MTSDRDRLIELLHKAEDICDSTLDCDTCKYVVSGSCKTVLIADYLLANGVIVPPCKAGDVVYQVGTDQKIYQSTITSVIYDTKGIAFDERAIGKTVFLTKEEAEAKLKEREGK